MMTLTDNVSEDVLDRDTRRFGLLLHGAGVVLTVLCCVAGYAWLYVPTKGRIADVAARIEKLKESVQDAPTVRSDHEQLTQRLKDLRVRIAALQQRVPPDADAGKFLKHVSEIARDEHLAISNFRPEKAAEKQEFAEMEVTLTAEGSFESICTFFDRLDKLARLSKVKHLSVTTKEASDELPMTATLVIYYGLRGVSNTTTQGVQRG